MNHPVNPLKKALREDRAQIGLWCSLASPLAAEVVAGSGFDFLLLDTEHAPNELPTIHAQLQAVACSTAAPVVRPAWNDAVLMKRLLDIGVQNLLVPFVQSAEEARRAVASTRYPPDGIRGVAVSTRANNYGRTADYFLRVHDELCVIVQLETRAALQRIEEIAAVDGADVLFVGPSDLAADMGHLGDSGHPEVRAAIEDAGSRIRKAGKTAGILTPVEADARHWLDVGFRFVAVGSDLGILARQTEALAARFKGGK